MTYLFTAGHEPLFLQEKVGRTWKEERQGLVHELSGKE